MIPWPEVYPFMSARFPGGKERDWVFGEEVQALMVTPPESRELRADDRIIGRWGSPWKLEYIRFGHVHVVEIRAYSEPVGIVVGPQYFYNAGPVLATWHVDDKPEDLTPLDGKVGHG